MKQHFEVRSKVGSLEVILLFILVFFSFFLFPQNSFAADAGLSSLIATAGRTIFLLWLIWLICYSRRKRPIGGWLLYYFITLYAGFFFSIYFLALSFSNYIPSGWVNKLHYFLFIITTIPGYIFLIAQFVLSFYLISQARRDWKYIEILRKVLIANFVFSVASIPIEATFWAQSWFFSIVTAISSLLWFFYFKKSLRVYYVFKDKQWNWEVFHSKKKVDVQQMY